MIENPKAPRVKRVAALARKKHRAELAEVVYATMGNEPWQLEIDRLASDRGAVIERVTEPVLAAMAETVHPQGVLAVARIEVAPLDASPGGVLAGARLVAILHEVRDPGNAGAVIRAADAAGADAVIFAGESIDPWHPKVVRSTTGSLFHVPVAVAGSLGEAVEAARAAGLAVFAADVRGDELTGATAALAGPVAWVFGNEARGLIDEDRALADRSLRLPIYGRAESLNLATAASVLLYETAFAQRAARTP